LVVIVNGACTTVTVSDADAAVATLVWFTSPPPDTVPVLMTLVGELPGTLTVSVMGGKLVFPPATVWVLVHVIALLPMQVQPVPP
jgi:hypothetical protein